MNQISRIYTKAYSNTPAAISADNELSEIIRREVLGGVMEDATLTKEDCSELVFMASSYGEEYGFMSGFRYALALVFESLCN